MSTYVRSQQAALAANETFRGMIESGAMMNALELLAAPQDPGDDAEQRRGMARLMVDYPGPDRDRALTHMAWLATTNPVVAAVAPEHAASIDDATIDWVIEKVWDVVAGVPGYVLTW